MFPFTYEKRLVYTVQGDARWAADKLREHLAQSLIKERARNVAVDSEYIQFTERLGRNSLPLLDGKITLQCHNDRLEIAYRISFIKVYLTILLTLVGVLILGWVSVSFHNALVAIIVLFCMFGFMGAFSIAIRVSCFNQFMRDSLGEFFNSVSGLGVQGELIASR